MFCSYAVQTSPEAEVLVLSSLNLPGLPCYPIKNYGSNIILSSGHGFGLCAESRTVVLYSECHEQVLSLFLYLWCYLHAITGTVSEQPALFKLHLSLGDFLCLSDSRCFARVYFWVFHDLASLCMCVFIPVMNSALIRVSQLPFSPNPLPPHSRKKSSSFKSVTNSVNTSSSPCIKTILFHFCTECSPP